MIIKLLFVILFLGYSAGLVYFAPDIKEKVGLTKNDIQRSIAVLNDPTSPKYARLQGTLEGKILKIEGNKVFLETIKGGKLIFDISPNVLVNEIKDGKLNKLGDTPQAVKIGENSSISLTGFRNGFAVSSVTYSTGVLPLSNPEIKPQK